MTIKEQYLNLYGIYYERLLPNGQTEILDPTNIRSVTMKPNQTEGSTGVEKEILTPLQIAVYAVNCPNSDEYVNEVADLIKQQNADLRKELNELKQYVENEMPPDNETIEDGGGCYVAGSIHVDGDFNNSYESRVKASTGKNMIVSKDHYAACLAALKECEGKNARLSETINELKCEIAYLEEQYKNKAH